LFAYVAAQNRLGAPVLFSHKQISELLEWPENVDIRDKHPADYVAAIQPRFSTEVWSRMQALHALPDGWQGLSYPDFLETRRHLMADIIRRGFESLQ
jgi:hypothetical protein